MRKLKPKMRIQVYTAGWYKNPRRDNSGQEYTYFIIAFLRDIVLGLSTILNCLLKRGILSTKFSVRQSPILYMASLSK